MATLRNKVLSLLLLELLLPGATVVLLLPPPLNGALPLYLVPVNASSPGEGLARGVGTLAALGTGPPPGSPLLCCPAGS